MTDAEQAAEAARIDAMDARQAEEELQRFWIDTYQTVLVATMRFALMPLSDVRILANLAVSSEDARILANLAVSHLEGFRVSREKK